MPAFSYAHLYIRFLSFSHAFPLNKPIQVIEKEHQEASDHRHRGGIVKRRHDPKGNEYNIVKRIRQRIHGTSENEKHGSEKARRNGKGADEKISRTERPQDIVEYPRNQAHRQNEKHRFRLGQSCDLDLCLFFIRIAKPRDRCKERGRRTHAEIRDHFAVISGGK